MIRYCLFFILLLSVSSDLSFNFWSVKLLRGQACVSSKVIPEYDEVICQKFFRHLRSATFDSMFKDFERSDTDFHMYWFSTKFWREYEKSMKRLWIDVFDSTWQDFVKPHCVLCTEGTLRNSWNKVRRSRWAIRKKEAMEKMSFGWGSSSSCERIGPVAALIVFVFPLIVSYDLIWVYEWCFVKYCGA